MRKHFRARIISFMGACVVTFLRGMELYSLRGHVEFIDLDWSRSFAVFHVYKICKKWTKFSYACFQLHTESLLYQAPGEDRKLLEWSFLDAGFRCRFSMQVRKLIHKLSWFKPFPACSCSWLPQRG